MMLLAASMLVPALTIQAQEPAQSEAAAETAKLPDATDYWSNRGRWTFGAQVGVAVENDIPRNISHIVILIAQPSAGFTLKDFHAPGFPVSRFSVVSEGILGGAVHPGGHTIGHTLLFRLDGKPRHYMVPFFDFGAGVLHTTIDARAPELSGHTQFNPQGGLGIQYFFNPQRAFVFEYRYMHMSNNGIQEPNHGFNASMITIGFRWLRRPRPPGWQPTHGHRGLGRFLFGRN